MPSFEIPDGPTTVPLKPGAAGQPRTGSATYSVTNKSTGVLAGRLKVLVAGDTKADWAQIAGDIERQWGPGETQTMTINFNLPLNVRPGSYKFKPHVFAVNDPNNDWTDGPVGTLQVAAGATPVVTGTKDDKKFPWWIVFVIIGAVVLIGGGILAFVLWPKDGSTVMADFSGKPVAEAEAQLAAMNLDLVVKKTEVEKPDATPGTIFDQTPKADDKLKKGEEVTLSVAVGPSIAVPTVSERSFDNASGVLEGVGLKAEKVNGEATGKPPGTVLLQDPAPGGRAGVGSTVKLTIDPGVPMPSLTNRSLEQAIRDASGKVNVSGIGTKCENGTVDEVVAQSPPSNTPVAKLSPVSVTIRKPIGYPCWYGHKLLRDLTISGALLKK